LSKHGTTPFYRQRAQQGAFTHLEHDTYADLEVYLDSMGCLDHVLCFEIPEQSVSEALLDLRRMNITYASLFPDLDGVAKHVHLEPFYRGAELHCRRST
jgi:hypothetical protein